MRTIKVKTKKLKEVVDIAPQVENNKLKLGKFQSLVLVELCGPREREIVVDYSEQT